MFTEEVINGFLNNLEIDIHDTISLRFGELTSALNKKFRGTESKTDNSIKVGSYGRQTAIRGLSDLDMLYVLPETEWANYKAGRQLALLQDCKRAIEARYPNTTLRCDRNVVVVTFHNYEIEVVPCFAREDGSFIFADSYADGSWPITNPLPERRAIDDGDKTTNQNLRRLCKIARAWRNKHGVPMGGLLVDTLVFNFFKQTSTKNDADITELDVMIRDFFDYLRNLEHQEYYHAPGSRQRVNVKRRFRRSARKAYDQCVAAIAAEGQQNYNGKWKKVFGRPFPGAAEIREDAIALSDSVWKDTEEFIEDKYPVDIRYNVEIECDVEQTGFPVHSLREMLMKSLPLKADKKLTFKATNIDVPEPYRIEWRVLNRGAIAKQMDMVRGQIVPDAGYRSKVERTSFRGEHVVDCYIIKNNVVVAKDRIDVPIQ